MANEIRLKITIDGSEASATVQLTEDEIKQLAGSLKEAGDEGKTSTEKMQDGFEKAFFVVQGFKNLINTVASAFGSLASAYGQQELAEVKLQRALKQTGNFTEENFKALKEYASELQRTTLFGDELYISLFGQLQAMGLTVEQTKAASLQAANLATVMGVDLSTAGRAMVEVFNGNIGMLGRYIKGLDETIIKSGDTAKIIEHLNERIGGQAEDAAKTGIGAIKQIENAFGDMKEEAGKLILQGLSPIIFAIRDVVSWLNNAHPTVSGFIVLITALTGVLITLKVTGLTGVIQSLMTWVPTMTAAGIATGGFTGMISAATLAVKAFFASLGPLGWAVLALGTIATAWMGISAAIGDANTETEEAIKKHQRLARLKEINRLLEIEQDVTRRFLLEREREQILKGEITRTSTGTTPPKTVILTLPDIDKKIEQNRRLFVSEEELRAKLAEVNELLLNPDLTDYDRSQLLRIRKQIEEELRLDPVPIIDIENIEEYDEILDDVIIKQKTFGQQIVDMLDPVGSLAHGFTQAGYAVSAAMGAAVKIFPQANNLLGIFINTLASAIVQAITFKLIMGGLSFLGGGPVGFVTGALPAMASGGVVTKPTLAVIGEGKEPEGVFPLSYLSQLMNMPKLNETINVNLTMNPVEFRQRGMDLRAVMKAVEKQIRLKR